jgi:hypothetical protein
MGAVSVRYFTPAFLAPQASAAGVIVTTLPEATRGET